MNDSNGGLSRRSFAKTAVLAGTVLPLGKPARALGAEATKKRIKTGVIGCGSVSHHYLPTLINSPHIELVSVCDILPERAAAQAKRFRVPHHYPHIDKMLSGEPFDLLVNLTDMQEHEQLNRKALEALKHVWSEKPIANSLENGQELLKLARRKERRLWGAPITVESPQFAFMARLLAEKKLGRVAAAHASYGHIGPSWSSFFYEKDGGSMPDLAVYNLTTLTGLLGPAKHVTAMLAIVTPRRNIARKGSIVVEAEDNAMLLLDHGGGAISHVQSGFNYFNPHGHGGGEETRYNITLVGTGGFMGLVGYDWEPRGVDLATKEEPKLVRHATDPKGYVWQQGAALAAECLATGRELLVTSEHALHVMEIITAARQSHETGRRVALKSTFKWPVQGA